MLLQQNIIAQVPYFFATAAQEFQVIPYLCFNDVSGNNAALQIRYCAGMNYFFENIERIRFTPRNSNRAISICRYNFQLICYIFNTYFPITKTLQQFRVLVNYSQSPKSCYSCIVVFCGLDFCSEFVRSIAFYLCVFPNTCFYLFLCENI